jgi:hypothetical protein
MISLDVGQAVKKGPKQMVIAYMRKLLTRLVGYFTDKKNWTRA